MIVHTCFVLPDASDMLLPFGSSCDLFERSLLLGSKVLLVLQPYIPSVFQHTILPSLSSPYIVYNCIHIPYDMELVNHSFVLGYADLIADR